MQIFNATKNTIAAKAAALQPMLAGEDGEAGDRLSTPPPNVALIVGVTGLVGRVLADNLLADPNWKVYGVARKADSLLQHPPVPGRRLCHFIACDLLDSKDSGEKLAELRDVTHVFWVAWASQEPLDTPASCEQNRRMMANALDAILPAAGFRLRHVALQTGAKHYISLTDPPPAGVGPLTEYDEECPRVPKGTHNFYYALEDLLGETLAGCPAGWSVHRPGLILGSSCRTHFNFMGSLCVYATICRHLDLPFVFGGSKMCWEEEYIDFSDARLVADQLIWAATSNDITIAGGKGEAFNSTNGPRFTWKAIWPAVAAKFGLGVPEPAYSPGFTFSACMGDKAGVWEEIVAKEGLRPTVMEELANWWFMDAVLRYPAKLLTCRSKADARGFTARFGPVESILYWVDRMREDRLIP